MQDILRVVQGAGQAINVILEEKIQELDEVEVVKSRIKTQKDLLREYDTNEDLIVSSFGVLNKKTAGYALYILGEGDFNENAPDLGTALFGRFPGLRTNGTPNFSNPAALYDIDGMVMTNPPPIQPAMIKRIAWIPGLAGTLRYGQLGSAGVIVINTKLANYAYEKKLNPATLQKEYAFDAIENEDSLNYLLPEINQQLLEAGSFDEAHDSFGSIYSSKVIPESFLVDAYYYFKGRWPNEQLPAGLGTFNQLKASENQYGFAYYLDHFNDQKAAIQAYEELLRSNPNRLESYWDLAITYEKAGDPEKALKLLLRADYLRTISYLPEADFGAHRLVSRDLSRLKQRIASGNSQASSANWDFEGTRIIVEWNNPDIDFTLQFVNPSNTYFEWNSVLAKPTKASAAEFLSEEFLIDAIDRGSWQINAVYQGNNILNPTYIRVVVFRNYGSDSPINETFVYRLQAPNVKQQLLKLTL